MGCFVGASPAGDPDPGQGEQELDALHAAELGSLARGQTAELEELGGEQELGLALELLSREAALQKN